MSKFWTGIIILAVIISVIALAMNFFSARNTSPNTGNKLPVFENISETRKNTEQPMQEENSSQENIYFRSPLERSGERVTKKPFGIFITPQNSPVQPEKFQGYHTGTDFEIFPEEINTDVSVVAICDGEIMQKKYAGGYGGILVQSCRFNNQSLTVLYGHLKLASISENAGDSLSAGEQIGILGKAGSAETDGERKHLHLGIHKGSAIDIHGYVQNQSELSGWIDPARNMSL